MFEQGSLESYQLHYPATPVRLQAKRCRVEMNSLEHANGLVSATMPCNVLHEHSLAIPQTKLGV